MLNPTAKHLLTNKAAAGLQDPCHLGQDPTPFRHMMNDAEIEHGIIARVRDRDPRGVADPQAGSNLASSEAVTRNRHHATVEIEGIDGVGPKPRKDEFGPDPPPTAQFQGRRASHLATHPGKPRRFNVPLKEGSEGVVHKGVFDTVQ